MMINNLRFVVLNCIVILLAGSIWTSGQENLPKFRDKRITIKMKHESLGKVFSQLINDYDVAIGFEESILDTQCDDYDFDTNLLPVREKRLISNDNKTQIFVKVEQVFKIEQHWITINIENGSLEEVLNIIVGQMENYKWDINNDVVNIFPIRGRDQRYEKLLRSNIKNFTLGKDETIAFVRVKIFALPEFTKFLNENNIYSSSNRSGMLNSLDRKILTEVNLSNITLRELLNKITKIKRGGWILKRNKSYVSKEYIEINI